MAIYIKTGNQQKILNQITKGIENNEIRIWTKDSTGSYFTYIAEQYSKEAYFKSIITKDYLVFGIIGFKGKLSLTRFLYSIYHSRFVEMLLTHLYPYFDYVYASSELKSSYDEIKKLV